MSLDMKALKKAAETMDEADYAALDKYLNATSPRTILSLIERCEELEGALRLALGPISRLAGDYNEPLEAFVAIDATLSKADATS